MVTLKLFVWFVVIGVEIYRNYYMIERSKERPNYTLSFILRGMAAIFHGILFSPSNWVEYFPVFIFQVTSFWILFDLGLNILRNEAIFYTGRDSGLLDKVGKFPLTYLLLKVAAFTLLVLSIIVIYTR